MSRPARAGGFGLLEFLVALLVFSSGILLVLHNQLLGARLALEGTQRSVATAPARDLVTRIQLNPGRAALYGLDAPPVGPESPAPEVDCSEVSCSGAELAAFEAWQWQGLLRGLVTPAVCVHRSGNVAIVAVGWFEREAGHTAAYRCRDGNFVMPGGSGTPGGLYSLKLHAWVGA